MPPIPMLRFLTPDAPPAAPAGFATVDDQIVQGLPHFVPLVGDLRIAVVVPTGLVRHWIDADPTLSVTRSAEETVPKNAAEMEPYGSAAASAPRLVLLERNTTLASTPLTLGLPTTLPESGAAGVRVDVVVLGWDLRAGSLRGAGNFGSRITLAWRSADAPVPHFSTPPVDPVLVKRLPPEFRMESRLGLIEHLPLRRFILKKVFR